MNHGLSVSLSVSWKPERMPVKWADSFQELPSWDMTKGVPSYTRHLTTMGWEEFNRLPKKEQKTELDRINTGVDFLTRQTLKGGDKKHRTKEDYPRLVRAWPGPSEISPPIPDVQIDNKGKPGQWFPQKPAYKALLELFPLLKKWDDFEVLRAQIVNVAHAYSLLNPAQGDSIYEWITTIARFKLIDQVAKKMSNLKGLGSTKDKELFVEEIEGFITSTHWKLVKQVDSAYWAFEGAQPSVLHDSKKVSIGEINEFVHELKTILAHFEPIPRNSQSHLLRARYLLSIALLPTRQIAFEAGPQGYSVRAGLADWAALEFSRDVLKMIRTCEVCGNLLSPRVRTDTKTCSNACRQSKKNGKRVKIEKRL